MRDRVSISVFHFWIGLQVSRVTLYQPDRGCCPALFLRYSSIALLRYILTMCIYRPLFGYILAKGYKLSSTRVLGIASTTVSKISVCGL